jgi:uncharacterized protein (TIRG00374 family)
MSDSPSRRKMPSWLPQLLGYALSIGCLLWVLHGYAIKGLPHDIRSLDWRWVIVSILADLAVYVAHGWRWNTLLAPVVRLRLWRTVQAIYIGLFANEVLPLRAGELIRCYLLAHWNDLRLSLSFASAAVERLIDGVWMLLAFLITAGFVRRIPKDLIILVQVLGALIILSIGGLFWIAFRRRPTHAVDSESRWSATLRHVAEGLQLMGNMRTLTMTSLISLLYLFLQILTVYALMKSYLLDLSFWVAAGVLAIIRVATVVPNAPGNVGLLNAACVLALRLFDVETNDAKTFSFILLAAQALPLLLGGAIATALTGLNIGEIHAHAKRRVRAPSKPPVQL